MKRNDNLLTVTLALAILFFTGNQAKGQTTWVAPASANSLKNPGSCDAATLKAAKTIYTSTCAPCHGAKGKGDGPAAVALNPKPADHTSKAIQGESDGSLFWKLSEGKGAMQAYKTQLTEKQRWSLICYLRTLKK